jgi:biopolymer transport protein ExbB
MLSSNWIVDITLMVLIFLSIATWSIAVFKYRSASAEGKLSRRFLDEYLPIRAWQKRGEIAKGSDGFYAKLVQAGYATCQELAAEESDITSQELQEILERELHKRQQILNRHREKGLAELASIGSTAPFIGLFGTVWGIMHALKTISATGQASIDVVAGPIGEALIATAIGIVTAIPAVLIYNYFLRQQRVQNTDLDGFLDGFVRFAMRNLQSWGEKC